MGYNYKIYLEIKDDYHHREIVIYEGTNLKAVRRKIAQNINYNILQEGKFKNVLYTVVRNGKSLFNEMVSITDFKDYKEFAIGCDENRVEFNSINELACELYKRG